MAAARTTSGADSTTEKNLARLAEMAEVISRDDHDEENNNDNDSSGDNTSQQSKRKRELEDDNDDPSSASASTSTAPKKKRTEELTPPVDVRFRDYQAEIWTEKFEDLCEFRMQHGHCHVPHTYEQNAALAQWVKRQRYQYKLKLENKRSTLTDERIKILDRIGFIWNSHDAVWEERWNELKEYRKIYNNSNVPSNYAQNPQLAVWVKRQRRQYKFYCEGSASSMTPERIARLEELDFAWDCRRPKSGFLQTLVDSQGKLIDFKQRQEEHTQEKQRLQRKQELVFNPSASSTSTSVAAASMQPNMQNTNSVISRLPLPTQGRLATSAMVPSPASLSALQMKNLGGFPLPGAPSNKAIPGSSAMRMALLQKQKNTDNYTTRTDTTLQSNNVAMMDTRNNKKWDEVPLPRCEFISFSRFYKSKQGAASRSNTPSGANNITSV